MIVLLGDNVSHEEDKLTLKKKREVVRYLSEELRKRFPQTPVVLTLGNHEAAPSDEFDNINYKDPLLKEMVNGYKVLLSDSDSKQLQAKGYYSKELANGKLKIISLLSHDYDSRNLYNLARSSNSVRQLNWLKAELIEAEKSNKSVVIITHISPGGPNSSSNWSRLFNPLLYRFKDTIKLFLSGHTHHDELTFFKNPKNENELSVVNFISPSLTTNYDIDPSYRIYELDGSNFFFKDYAQYRIDYRSFNENVKTDDQKLIWELAYRFKEYYNIFEVNEESLNELVEKLEYRQQPEYNKYQCQKKAKGQCEGYEIMAGGFNRVGGKNCEFLDSQEKAMICLGYKNAKELYEAKNLNLFLANFFPGYVVYKN